MYPEVMQGIKHPDVSKIKSDVYLLRFIKPLDEEYFITLATKYKAVLFVEDGVIDGGISEYLQSLLFKNKYLKSKILAFENKYYGHASRAQILEEAGLSPEDIAKAVKELVDA